MIGTEAFSQIAEPLEGGAVAESFDRIDES
jgi:hypothetical protein